MDYNNNKLKINNNNNLKKNNNNNLKKNNNNRKMIYKLKILNN